MKQHRSTKSNMTSRQPINSPRSTPTQLQQNTISNDLTLITPYYIDRRKKPPIIHSPRCLHSSRGAEVRHLKPKCCNCSFNSQAFRNGNCQINHLLKKQRKTTNNLLSKDNNCISQILQEISPSAQPRRLTLQWNTISTLQFKNNMKQLLKQYYEIKQKQKQELANKVRISRLSQIDRISKALQQMLLVNQQLYNSIRHECENPISNKLCINECDQQSDLQSQKFKSKQNDIDGKFIQIFTNKYIQDQDQQKVIDNQYLEEKIQQFFTNQIARHPKQIKSLQQYFMRSGKQKNSVALNKLSSFLKQNKKNSKRQSSLSNLNNSQNMRLKRNAGKIKSEIIMKLFNEQLLSKNVDKQLIDELESVDLESLKKNFQLKQKLQNMDSGSDKFYHIIRQLLQRNKHDKNQQSNIIQSKQISDDDQELQQVHKQLEQQQEKDIVENLPKTIVTRPNKNKKLTETYKPIPRTSNSAQQRTLRKKHKTAPFFMQKKPMSMPKNNNKQKRNQTKVKNQTQRVNKTSDENIKEDNQKTHKQKVQEKPKQKGRNKMGLNYAKFIGKLLKLAQNQKSNIHPQKIKRFGKISTRQAFLKKDKNKYKIQQSLKQQTINDDSNNLKLIAQENNVNRNESKQESIISEDAEKKCRMTKYQQARLMYNMRNIKSRQILSNTNNFSSTNGFLGDNMSSKQKRPSFYSKLQLPDGQNKIKSKRGSFTRRRNDDNQQLEDLIANNQFMCGTRPNKFYQYSSRYLNSQLELPNLTSLEQFDLQLVKSNITSYLRKFMIYNEKAKQLYNFLMYMEQSRKITLQQHQINSSLDQLKIQKEQDQIKKLVSTIQPNVDDYQGCNNLYDYFNWNQKNILMTNKKFLDKLDARSIQLLYWSNQDRSKFAEDLTQCSLKQIRNIPV